jgi:hypothetical protein
MSKAKALAELLWANENVGVDVASGVSVAPKDHVANASQVDFVNAWLQRKGIACKPVVLTVGNEANMLELLRVFSEIIISCDSQTDAATGIREQLAR